MNAIDQQITHIRKVKMIAWVVALIIGGATSVGLSYVSDVFVAGYIGFCSFFATFSLIHDLFVRRYGRWRSVFGTLFSIAIYLWFFFNFANIPTYLSKFSFAPLTNHRFYITSINFLQTHSSLLYAAPIVFAYLTKHLFYPWLVYLFRPPARREDRLLRLLSSSQAQARSTKLDHQIEALEQEQLRAQKPQFQWQLVLGEQATTASSAERRFRRVIAQLTVTAPLPPDLQRLLGRAYLGLAHCQAGVWRFALLPLDTALATPPHLALSSAKAKSIKRYQIDWKAKSANVWQLSPLPGITEPRRTTPDNTPTQAANLSRRLQLSYNDPKLASTLAQALAYPLPFAGSQFVAHHYAQLGERSAHAYDAYLAYFQARKEQRRRPVRNLIERAAQALCQLNPQDSQARHQEVEQLARAFLTADERLDWAALLLGQSLLGQDKLLDAQPLLQGAAAAMPHRLDAWLTLGYVHWRLKQANWRSQDAQSAVDAFRHALGLAPDNLESKFWLGYSLVDQQWIASLPDEQGKAAAAEACQHLESIATIQSQRIPVRYGLALAHLTLEHYSTARRYFADALSAKTNSADWYYHYARALVVLQDTPSAYATLQRALDLAPQHHPALLLYGATALRYGHSAVAVATYQTLLTLDPADEGAQLGLGIALFHQGQYVEAAHQLQIPQRSSRDRLYYCGRVFAKLGDFQRSLYFYRQALTEFSPDAELFYAFGCALAHVQQFDQALAALQQALTLQPSLHPHLQCGHIYLHLNQYEQALTAYQAARQLAPKSPDVHHALGMYHYRTSDLAAAQQAFSTALTFDPNYAPAHVGVGVSFERQNDLAQAKVCYERALAIDQTHLPALLRLGVVAVKQQLYAVAVTALTQVRNAGGQTAELLYHLGLAHARLGDWTAALAAWLPLQQRCPGQQQLRSAIACCYYQQGFQSFKEQDWGAASEAWEEAAKAHNNDETLHHTLHKALAEVYFRYSLELLRLPAEGQKLPTTICATVERAGHLAPANDPRHLYLQALTALAEHKYEQAVQHFGSLYNANQADERTDYHLGFALYQLGQVEQALPYLERALQTQLPVHLHLGAQLMLAAIHTQAHRWPEAAQVYQAAFLNQASSRNHNPAGQSE